MSRSTLESGENFETLTGRDRRRSERVPHVMAAWLASPTATDPDDKTEVTSINLSRHGLAFNCTNPIPVGTFFVIELGIGVQQMKSEVRIVSCRWADEGGFEIGAEFC